MQSSTTHMPGPLVWGSQVSPVWHDGQVTDAHSLGKVPHEPAGQVGGIQQVPWSPQTSPFEQPAHIKVPPHPSLGVPHRLPHVVGTQDELELEELEFDLELEDEALELNVPELELEALEPEPELDDAELELELEPDPLVQRLLPEQTFIVRPSQVSETHSALPGQSFAAVHTVAPAFARQPAGVVQMPSGTTGSPGRMQQVAPSSRHSTGVAHSACVPVGHCPSAAHVPGVPVVTQQAWPVPHSVGSVQLAPELADDPETEDAPEPELDEDPASRRAAPSTPASPEPVARTKFPEPQ